jgi:UDP-N-acetylglucosamine 2-epimerase
MKIISVVGARPNFMKIAPFIRAIHSHNRTADTENRIEHLLVHTGQHYDDRMSRAFFEDLDIPDADINLGVGSGTHAEQVGHTMIAFEKVRTCPPGMAGPPPHHETDAGKRPVEPVTGLRQSAACAAFGIP